MAEGRLFFLNQENRDRNRSVSPFTRTQRTNEGAWSDNEACSSKVLDRVNIPAPPRPQKCTVQVNDRTRVVRGKTEEASRELLGASDSGQKTTPVLRRVLTMRKCKIKDRRENKTVVRAEKGDKYRSPALLEDTIVVLDFGV